MFPLRKVGHPSRDYFQAYGCFKQWDTRDGKRVSKLKENTLQKFAQMRERL
jgi:hypothetical protein